MFNSTFKKPGKPLARTTPMKSAATALKRTAFSQERAVPKKSSLHPGRKRRASAADRAYMAMVATHGCIVCSYCLGIEGTPAEVHHLKAGGGSKRAPHTKTMPLCPEHHRGDSGIHLLGQDGFLRRYGISETNLLAVFQRQAGVADA